MNGRFTGKVALVTGGGSGLGRAIALGFAREGARVCVVGRREEKLDETAALDRSGNIFGLAGDVRDAARVEAIVNEVVERTGRIDVLVNNAAGNFVVPAARLSPNGFKSVVDIVLLGTFHCSRFAFDALCASRGAILNIVATYAWSGEPGVVHSASAKAGVLAMTRTLAAEWGSYGIRVNALAPGPIHTEGTDKNLWGAAAVPGSAFDERIRREIPLGRLGDPADVERAALWLCSDEASWVSGATLAVDGAHWLGGGRLGFTKELGNL
ncbi:MAG: SDR family oxidoreductase [Candidatus Tyrphobacter sp.]